MFRAPSVKSIFILITVLVTFATVILAGTESPKPEAVGSTTCPQIVCTKAPQGLSCNKTEVKSPALLKRIGKLKNCCPAWRCQEEDGSFSTYFGMSGSEIPPAVVANSTGSPSDNTTEKPGETHTHPPGPIKVPEDKCAEAKTICPIPDGPDTCAVSTSKESMAFKPKGELDSCCPTYNCTQADGAFNLHYILSGGKAPTDPAAIEAEKGKPEGAKKCPKIACAPDPPMNTTEGPKCSATKEHDSSRMKALGPFRECCEAWKCIYEDGAYYTHFELQSTSVWLAETTFHSEAESPDELDEATEAPLTNSTQASVANTTVTTTTTTVPPTVVQVKPSSKPKKGKSVSKPEVLGTVTAKSMQISTTEDTEVEDSTTTGPIKKKKKSKKVTKTKPSSINHQSAVVGYSTNTESQSSWSAPMGGPPSGQTVVTSETHTYGDPNIKPAVPQGAMPVQMSPAEQQVMLMQQMQGQPISPAQQQVWMGAMPGQMSPAQQQVWMMQQQQGQPISPAQQQVWQQQLWQQQGQPISPAQQQVMMMQQQQMNNPTFG